MQPKNTICLRFQKHAQEAAHFYAATFPDSKVTGVQNAPCDYPGGKKGDALDGRVHRHRQSLPTV